MVDADTSFERMKAILAECGAEYRLYEHRVVLSYEDADLAREEAGFIGTDGKALVCAVDGEFAVFVTLQGSRLDMKAVKQLLGARKVKLATADELRDGFGAQPGAAYPFGFGDDVTILIDPAVYEQEWIVFSAPPPTVTLQVRGGDLRSLFEGLPNPTFELSSSA